MKPSPLPMSLAPRGLSRPVAAAYIGVSPSKFDDLVAKKLMPRPLRIENRRLWDKIQIDAAFSALADEPDEKPVSAWDNIM